VETIFTFLHSISRVLLSLQDRIALLLIYINIANSFSLSFLLPPPKKNTKYIRVIEILLALILVDGQGTITSKARTFVVLQLVTNVALIEYT
jgi:hypothetical protein